MGFPTTPALVLCAYLAFLLQSSTLTFGEGGALSFGDGGEWYFNYDQGSKFGPQHWGDLHQEWATCKYGEAQSPIDIDSKNVQPNPGLKSLDPHYQSSSAYLQNTGHNLRVWWPRLGAGYVSVDGRDYYLDECHWHSPSEHTIDGQRYPLELHMVHMGPGGSRVIGILYQFGPPDPFLSKLHDYMVNITDTAFIGGLYPPVLEGSAPYFTYLGSLTTPPCSEGVTWILIQEVQTVTREQVQLLRAAVHHKSNARPVQPINSRTVHRYDGWSADSAAQSI